MSARARSAIANNTAIRERVQVAADARRGFMLLLTDETGPLSSIQMPSSWRHHEQPVLEQLVRAAYPGLTVLAVKWAEDPKLFTCSGDVLLVSVPGTHEVAVPKKRTSKPRKVSEVDVADQHDGYRHTHQVQQLRDAKFYSAPALKLSLVPEEVVNRCSCGIAYTAETWAALELRGAKDITEGATVIHEDYRNCTCGSTRMVFTTRLAGEGA